MSASLENYHDQRDMEKRNTLEYYAAHRCTSFNKMSQAAYIKARGLVNADGVCYALSAFYVVCRIRNWPFKTELASPAVGGFIDKLQSVLNSTDHSPGLLPGIPGRVERGFATAGLQVLGLSPMIRVPFSAAAAYVRQSQGYYILLLPTHAIVACNEGGGAFRLFDPNYGQALFANDVAFTTCLESFLSDLKIMESYGMRDGEPVMVLRVAAA